MAYLALARAGFRRWSSYRAATLAGVFTNTDLRVHPRRDPARRARRRRRRSRGYSRADAITYTWLTQALIMMIAMWNWVDLATRIQTGDIVTDLQRPIDLQAAYLSEDHGRALYQLLARGLPPFLVGALVYDLDVPRRRSGSGARSRSASTLAVVVSFGMRFIVNLLAFWVLDWRGLLALSSAFTTVASGLRRSRSRSSRRGPRRLFIAAAVGVDDPDPDRRLHRPPYRRDARERARAPAVLGDRAARASGAILLATRPRRVVVQGG